MNTESFLISSFATIREALLKIEFNSSGFILSTDSVGKVNGLATDGDIRRKLLSGLDLDAPISDCVNADFFWAKKGTPKEELLKKLDRTIRAIPILDESGLLISVVTRDTMPVQNEEPVYARARAPVRISFGGGGSDLTHFFWDYSGAVINATISIYSHATLRLRNDSRIIIHSLDLGETLEAGNLQEALQPNEKFGLIQAVLKVINPDFGFELFLNSDFPMGSGLGGSAVVTAVILGCFNEFRRDKWDNHELAELAFQAERFNLGVSGGWQDQYATVFGGFNFMEFKKEQNIVHPLRIPHNALLELEESLILCNTGLSHDSGNVHDDQREKMKSEEVQDKVRMNVELTYEMRNSLLRGKLLEVGTNLNKTWLLKKEFSNKISTPYLDEIYDLALNNGAIGGKLLGAGGGGFFLFFVTPFKKHQLLTALVERGLKNHPFKFDQDGLRSWIAREDNN